jgi:hypothetical protein
MLTVIKYHVIKSPQIFSSLCPKPQNPLSRGSNQISDCQKHRINSAEMNCGFFKIIFFIRNEKIRGRGNFFLENRSGGGVGAEYINHKTE